MMREASSFCRTPIWFHVRSAVAIATVCATVAAAAADDGADAGAPPSQVDAGTERGAILDAGSEPDGGVEHPDEGIDDETAEADAEVARAPGDEPIGPQPDPALARSLEELTALVRGELPSVTDVDGLFGVSLDRPAALKQRLSELPAEVAQIEARLGQIEAQLKSPDALVPAVEQPPIVAEPPVKPDTAAAPVEPVKPEGKRRRWYPPGKENPWEVYDRALEEYELARQEYEVNRPAIEAELAEYEKLAAAFDEARATLDLALAKRRAEIAASVAQLRQERADARARLGIARAKAKYLTALQKMLEVLPEPALQTLRSLRDQRGTLRSRAESLRRLETAFAGLLERTELLHNRAAAGSLVGFDAQREELAENLRLEVESLRARLGALRSLIGDIDELAADLEQRGREVRREILASALDPERVAVHDAAFLEHLRISRSMSRSGTGPSISELTIQNVIAELEGALEHPESLTTVADAELEWSESHAAFESAAQIQGAIPLSLDRHRKAFERELVTLYSPLASEQTRGRANSFSALVLEDLLADGAILIVDLSLWAEGLVDQALRVPELLETTGGQIRLARVGGGMVLIVLLVILRRRIRTLVSRLMIRVANSRPFRNRAGLLVRLTVFMLAILPIGVVAGAGYGLMALIGFDHAEVRFVEVVFRWLVFYFIGRQVVLGLTRQESRGRPPLFPVKPETTTLLRVTYARLGLVLFLVAIADEISRDWLGTGSLASAVRLVALFWLGLMALWAIFAWRRTLAGTCAEIAEASSSLGRFARWARDHIPGALFTPLFLLWVVPILLFRIGKRLLAEGGLLSLLRAKLLRRMSRRTTIREEQQAPVELPERYVAQFPLYPLQGEEGEVLLPRQERLDRALVQIKRWQRKRMDGSLVVVGEKGIGKTTFLALLDRATEGIYVSRHTLNRKYRSEQALVADLAEAFGFEGVQTVGALAAKLRDGGEQVVLLDEAHNVFLRTIDGFRAVEALGRLVNHTSENVFWVLVFNSHAWNFVSRASRHARIFRQVLRLPAWTQDEIEELIARRNERAGLEIEFEELLLDAEESSTGGFELVASADGFFRLLWEVSRGNPRVATYLWLRALTPVTPKKLRVGLIREEPAAALEKMDPELLFALAAVAQHENLSYDELRQALNASVDEAAHAGRYLGEQGFLEAKHNDPRRMTLAPRFHRQVLRALRENHLLFEEE
jgi:hypothetical protein